MKTNRNGFRPIKCNLHGKNFYGKGTTQVYRKVMFTFCSPCWMDKRHECNELMRRVAEPAQQQEKAA